MPPCGAVLPVSSDNPSPLAMPQWEGIGHGHPRTHRQPLHTRAEKAANMGETQRLIYLLLDIKLIPGIPVELLVGNTGRFPFQSVFFIAQMCVQAYKARGKKRLLKYKLALDIPSVKIPCFPPLDYKHILQVNFGATCSGKCLSWKAWDFQSDDKCLFSLPGFWLEIYLEYREPGFSFCSAQSQTKPHGSSCTSPGQGQSRNYPQYPYFGKIGLKAWRWWIYTLSPEALMEIMYHHLHFSNEKGEGHMMEDIYLLSAKTPETAQEQDLLLPYLSLLVIQVLTG